MSEGSDMMWVCLILILATKTVYGQHTDGDAIHFTLYGGSHTWNEAFNICQSINGNMLHLHTPRDVDIFETFANVWMTSALLTGDVWTGLLDNDPGGSDFQFVFENCHPFNDNDSLWSLSLNSEPDDKGVSKCVRFRPNDGLFTTQCYRHFSTVCQTDLGSCWFDDFAEKSLDLPGAIRNEVSGLSLDECKQHCQAMNTPGNLCIAIELNEQCILYTGTPIYIYDTPAMVDATKNDTVAVKRCFEGTYEEIAPIVPENNYDNPAPSCIETIISTSQSSSVFLSTTLETVTSERLTNTMVTASTSTSTILETVSASEKLTNIMVTASTSTTEPTSMATLPTASIDPTFTSLTTKTNSITEPTTTDTASKTEPTTVDSTFISDPTTADTASEIIPSGTEAANEQNVGSSDALSTVEVTKFAESLTTDVLSLVPSTSDIASTFDPASNLVTPTSNVTSSDALETPVNDITSDTVTSPAQSQQCNIGARQCICIEFSQNYHAALEALIASLVLDKKDLSSHRRKKTSAPDYRVSAISIGKFGIAIVGLVFISIVLLDCNRVFGFVSSDQKKKKNKLDT